MILVGQYDSPYVRRVAVSLHMLELPFARDTKSVFSDAEAMRRINPLGRVPSLVLDDGEVLVDSGAILDHLDEHVGPARALVPACGPARRRTLQDVAIATGAIDKAAAIAYERLLRPPEKQHAPWLERCAVQLAAALAALEARPQSPWLGGAAPLQSDVTAACLVGYLKLRVPDAFAAGRYPALEALASRAERLAAFEATWPGGIPYVPGGAAA